MGVSIRFIVLTETLDCCNTGRGGIATRRLMREKRERKKKKKKEQQTYLGKSRVELSTPAKRSETASVQTEIKKCGGRWQDHRRRARI